MTKNIKRLLSLAITIPFLLTGCNSPKPSPSSENPSSEKESSENESSQNESSQNESSQNESSEEESSESESESESSGSESESSTPVEQYTITVVNGTGGGTFDVGSSVTITATVPEDQVFDYWELDGQNVSEENPYSFTVEGDATYTAHFKMPPHPMAAYAKNVYKKSDKPFKVLSLTDIQLHDGENVNLTLDVIDQLVEKEEPDMIVHVGDLINDSDTYASLNNYVAVLDKINSFDIPWAAVLGNHDYETYQAGYESMKTTTSEQLMNKFMSYDNCVVSYGPENVTGKSNFIVNVLDESTDELVHSLYFLDSYLSGVDETHADFYRSAVDYSTSLNDGNPVESSMYVHIPLRQYTEVIKASKANEYRDLVGSYNRNPEDLASGSETVFEAIEELGTTKNVICGHDHENAFYGYYHGFRLAYSMKSSNGDNYDNPAQIGGAILSIDDNVDFYYSKADIQLPSDQNNRMNVCPDILPYWRYSGAKVNFDIEMLDSEGTIEISLCGTNIARYSIDEKDRYGAWNRLTVRIHIDVANKTIDYGELTQIPETNKYHCVLDVAEVPMNDAGGEEACGDETMRLMFFNGGEGTNRFLVSNVYYDFENITETNQIDLATATIDEIDDQFYNFSQYLKPEVTVKVNDNTLSKVDDILVTYENNTEIGEATVRVVPSGKGAHNYKGEKTATFNIVVNPDGDTIPGHENAAVVNESTYTIQGKNMGITPVNDWKNSGKAFYFEIKRMTNGSHQSGETFRFSLLGNNSNEGHKDEETGNWNRLTAFYILEFDGDTLTVHRSGSTDNIATVTDLGDRWLGVSMPYSAFELNESGEGAMGNANETFTLCYIVDITRSFRIDNISSTHTI